MTFPIIRREEREDIIMKIISQENFDKALKEALKEARINNERNKNRNYKNFFKYL